jgi:preprotein translocase subunit SecA
MGVTQRLRNRMSRFLQRPGTTVDLTPLRKNLPAIREREDELTELDDAALTERARAATSVVDICAVGREAARRGLGERPYDVQLLGAMAMLGGSVAEMATGEGKTLTAAIAAYGHARSGNGPVHVLTVNDYLARRDAEWMEPVYTLLGLSVGWVTEASTHEERLEAYARDVTYVSVSEAGFDYLRDQLVTDLADRVQRELSTAIVDEADSILIDEARVPMVLAGAVPGEQDPVHAAAAAVRGLRANRHYEIADDGRSVAFTTAGLAAVEKALGDIDLYDDAHVEQLSAANVALHAHALLHRDVDYIVRGGAVELIDEMRGRVAQRRRWPDGLQAAVEAKEGLDQTAEGEVLGTITVQAFVALYPTVCGMTATAVLVGDQLREYFRLEVAVIPPNTPCIRVDEPDRIYATRGEKEDALVAEIAASHEVGRPVLVGTLDVKESESLAAALAASGVPCVVLNAKNDDEEAAIIAEAGTYGAVTVSTQMAGRGVDIRLGGSDQADRDRVAGLGGLYVLGGGRHHSRRVDDQLRGRAGRQGDPGTSVFFVSLEDELIQRHAPDAVPPSPRMNADGLVTDEQVDFAVEHAQRISEGVQHEIHRNTWRYSVVIEQQRKALAERRERLLTTDVAAQMLRRRSPDKAAEVDALDEAAVETDDGGEPDDAAVVAVEADLAAIEGDLGGTDGGTDGGIEGGVAAAERPADEPARRVARSDVGADGDAEVADVGADGDAEVADEAADERPADEPAGRVARSDERVGGDAEVADEAADGEGTLSRVGRSIALYQLDRLWAEHLAELSEVREGVHLRALGRLDPLDEFHRSAVPAFNALVPAIEERTVESFDEMQIGRGWQPDASSLVRPSATWTYLVHDNPFGSELDRLIAAVGRRLGGGSR